MPSNENQLKALVRHVKRLEIVNTKDLINVNLGDNEGKATLLALNLSKIFLQ
jgi:hypothetical protein